MTPSRVVNSWTLMRAMVASCGRAVPEAPPRLWCRRAVDRRPLRISSVVRGGRRGGVFGRYGTADTRARDRPGQEDRARLFLQAARQLGAHTPPGRRGADRRV